MTLEERNNALVQILAPVVQAIIDKAPEIASVIVAHAKTEGKVQ